MLLSYRIYSMVPSIKLEVATNSTWCIQDIMLNLTLQYKYGNFPLKELAPFAFKRTDTFKDNVRHHNMDGSSTAAILFTFDYPDRYTKSRRDIWACLGSEVLFVACPSHYAIFLI